jgi:hypothetical protein
MATPYSYFPIPKTGIGFHDSSNTGAIPANLDVWAQAMAARGVSVYKVLADGVNKVGMAAALVRAGIVPIVRLYGHQPHPRLTVHPGWVAPYVAAGARLFEWGNEPNIGAPEWENETFPPRSEFGRLIGEQWLRNAAQIRAEGGIPLFVAMTPGGYHDHRIAYVQILDYLHSVGKLGTFEQAALAIHPRPHTVPPHVPPTQALTVAFKEYEWIAGLFQTYLGWVPPMYATEHGYSPNDSTPTGYPPIDENQAAQYNRVLFEMMNPAHVDRCPRYLLGLAYWLETEGGTWARDEAFRHRFPGEPTVWGNTFLAMNITWDRRAYVTGGTVPPPPPPPDPTPPPGDDIQLPAWCSVTRAVVPAGGRYWHLKRAYWQDSDTSGGTHHIYAVGPHDAAVSLVVNVEGTNVVDRVPLDKPATEPAGNYAMWEENIHRAVLEGRGITLSDSVAGMTMPQRQHVSYFLEWEERTKASDPMPPTYNMTTRFVQLATAEFGDAFEDLRATLPQHTTLRFDPIDSRTMQYNCFHHTATAVNTTWRRIAEAHVNERGWPGIGYHMGVRQGKVALVGDLDTQRAHVLNRNDEALGIAWVGNSDTVPVPLTDIDLLRRLVKVLDALYDANKENTWHGAMLPGYTVCPGSDLRQIVPTLRIPPAPPPAPELKYDKIVWAFEQSARILQAEGYQREHDAMLGTLTYEQAVHERDT